MKLNSCPECGSDDFDYFDGSEIKPTAICNGCGYFVGGRDEADVKSKWENDESMCKKGKKLKKKRLLKKIR